MSWILFLPLRPVIAWVPPVGHLGQRSSILNWNEELWFKTNSCCLLPPSVRSKRPVSLPRLTCLFRQTCPGTCVGITLNTERLTPAPCTMSTPAATTWSNPLFLYVPAMSGGGGVGAENSPITLEEAQSWSNGGNIKRVLRQVTYLMDPGAGGRGRGKDWGVRMDTCRGWEWWGENKGAWGEVRGGVNATARLWHKREWETPWRCPSALEQTVIETTLINFCTLSPAPAAMAARTMALLAGGIGTTKNERVTNFEINQKTSAWGVNFK